MLSVAPAPAFAASNCVGTGVCPAVSFGVPSGTANSNGMNGGGLPSAGNGWTATTTSGWNNSNIVGFQTVSTTSYRFGCTSEPNSAGRVVELTQAGQPALKAGCSYRLTFDIVQYISGSGVLTLYLVVGTTEYAIYTTSGQPVTNSNVAKTGNSFAIPTTASGAVGFRFRFSSTGASDDLTLYNQSLTCLNT